MTMRSRGLAGLAAMTMPARGPAAARPGESSTRFETLDSLRGIAAMVVVFDHCAMLFRPISDGVPVTFRGDPMAWLLLHSPLALLIEGRGAVALFFVLSGFVLALPWLNGRQPGYAAFVVRRVCRIWLPYAMAVAVAVLLGTALATYPPPAISQWFDRTNWSEPLTPGVVADYLFMLGRHDTLDNATWSLVYEMRVSLIFPLLVLPVRRWGLAGAVATAAMLTLLAKLAGMWPAGGYAAVTVGQSLHWAVLFVLGIATAQQAARLRAWFLAGPAWTEWVVLAGAAVFLWQYMPYQRDFFLGVGGMLAIVAALLPGRLHRLLQHRRLRALGRISYSLYLVHLLVLLPAAYLLHDIVPLWLIVVLAPPAALVAAWGFNRLVEEPANRLGRRLTRRSALRLQLLGGRGA
jgi:peptidoglycan/LPS O-acetylase OafA/YrhL